MIKEKNAEIERLKENQPKLNLSPSTSSISSSIQEDYNKSETTNALTKMINERDEKILQLQEELQTATNDIRENTEMIESLVESKKKNEDKIENLALLIKDLKKQLKMAHARSKDLQNKLNLAEKLYVDQDEKVKHILLIKL